MPSAALNPERLKWAATVLGLVIELVILDDSWSAENAIFCYIKITEPCSRQMEENHPIW